MAVEWVVNTFLSSSLEFVLEKIKSGEVLAYLRGKSKSHDFDELVGKLKTTLTVVMAVIGDAEQKQRKSKSVELWLDMLQEAVFDAEDLLDLIDTDAMESKEKAESSVKMTNRRQLLKRKFQSFISGFRGPDNDDDGGDMESKVKKLLERFEFIASQKDLLGLEMGTNQEKASWRIHSTSLVDESEVYGRDYDKGEMTKFLLSDDVSDDKTGVISIVGMGGVGKTTLAQTIYNDRKVKEHFELKAWVCVSEEFDVCRVTRTILEEVTSCGCDVKELNSLQVKLKESLFGKKFLIVLDDVWHEKPAELDVLCLPFRDGARGSKIIVTTRSEKVASSMRTVRSLFMQNLSEEDSWKLFAKKTCGINGDFNSNRELEKIGREIVKKCAGLPLALTTLSGLLCSTLEVEEWRRILESDIWDLREDESNILPALRLSYHYLPSQLKRCFAYCSIFPTDYEFKKDELILLWMAENILESPKTNRRIEDVGQEYFNVLVSRSIFQRSGTQKSVFVMHDLVHDLAKHVSAEYYFHLEDGKQSGMNVEKVHHLGYIATNLDPYKRFSDVLQATNLRTFLPQRKGLKGWGAISIKAVNDLFLKLRYLRVLSLSDYRNFDHLPDSIGELRHLRYLDVSSTEISSLPESICKLLNLQTLKLECCWKLMSLPKDMHRLINLRHLDLRNCNSLAEMPTGLSKLKNLQMLSTFIVGKDNGTKIGELSELPNLRGELCIEKLENVGNARSALNDAKLRDKKNLDSLSLKWTSNDDSEHARDVLDMLLPATTLKKLCIYRYPGREFPNWFVSEALGNTVSITLSMSTNCSSLPPLGQLPSLKILEISYFDALVDVGSEFYCGVSRAIKPFQSLEILKFSNMPAWERWFQHDCEAFSKLKELDISACRKLTGVFPFLLPSLTKINISNCDNLAPPFPIALMSKIESCESIVISNCSSPVPISIRIGCLPSCLKKLVVEECKGLEIKFDYPHRCLEVLNIITNTCDALESSLLDYFPKLKELRIGKSERLESLSISDGLQSQNLKSLTSMEISRCSSLVSFPKGGLSAPNLTNLVIRDCNKLKSLPEKMHSLLTSLKHLEMDSCPEIESLPQDGLPFSLTELTIRDCSKLVASRGNWGLKRIPNLRTFGIDGNNEDMESFPEEGLLPVTIASLNISGFPCLKSMDKNELRKLTSLEEIQINRLPKLQTIPGEAFSFSVKSMSISKCNELRTASEEDLPTSLENLIINRCRNCQAMLEKGLPGSLKHVHISNCDKLESVVVEGLLSSLSVLLISFCTNLKTITSKFPNSLQHLYIQECPLLAEKCKPENGEYWSYIAHIPCVNIELDIFVS